jgi:hypothetical protein
MVKAVWEWGRDGEIKGARDRERDVMGEYLAFILVTVE